MTSHLQFHEGTVFEKKMLMARILQLGSHHMVGFQWISGKSYIYIHPWDPYMVYYAYLHLVDVYGKCRQLYHTWILWHMYIYIYTKVMQ